MSRRIVLMIAALAVVAVGLGFYAFHLKKRFTHDEQDVAEQQIAPTPPTSGPPEQVTLYVADDTDGTLRKMQLGVVLPPERSERDRAVLQALMAQYLKSPSSHPVGSGAEILQVFLLDDGTAVVDTSSSFADAHPSGVLAEELTIASLVVTLNANDSKVARVKILVNGQERETLAGHADLKRFYQASNIGAIVKDMQ
jgi:spore germination protein GerM